MILRVAAVDVTTLRLDRDDGVAAFNRGKMKFFAAASRVCVRHAPRLGQIILQLLRQTGELDTLFARVPRQFTLQEDVSEFLHGADIEAVCFEIGQQRFDRSECV